MFKCFMFVNALIYVATPLSIVDYAIRKMALNLKAKWDGSSQYW